jgi:hypothetical protein
MGGVCTGDGPCDTTPLGTGKNWVTKRGGLPDYIRAVAHSLQGDHTESEAIQLAIGAIQRWARGEGKVTPATRARAAAALVQWEAMKGASLSTTEDAMSLSQRIRRTFAALKPKATIELVAPVPHAIDLANGPMAARVLPDEASVRKAAANLSKLSPPLQAVTRAMILKRAAALKMDPDSLNLSNPISLTIDLGFNPAEARGPGGLWTAGQSAGAQSQAQATAGTNPQQFAMLAQTLGISQAQLAAQINSGAININTPASAAAKKASAAGASASKKAATASASAAKKQQAAAVAAQKASASAAKKNAAAQTTASAKAGAATLATNKSATTASSARAQGINNLPAAQRTAMASKTPPAGYAWTPGKNGPTLTQVTAQNMSSAQKHTASAAVASNTPATAASQAKATQINALPSSQRQLLSSTIPPVGHSWVDGGAKGWSLQQVTAPGIKGQTPAQAASAAKSAASKAATNAAASAMPATKASTARANAINTLTVALRTAAAQKAPPAGFQWTTKGSQDGAPILVPAH